MLFELTIVNYQQFSPTPNQAMRCFYPCAGPDPDTGPLGGGGTNFGEGSRGPPRPLWVQGKAQSKTIFSTLNDFGELSFTMFLAYFFIFRV